jgi:hypothetical protein
MASTPRTLSRFTVAPQANGTGFRLHIEDETGEVLEVDATRDKVEVLTDALDEVLANTEAPQGDPDLPARDADGAASAPTEQRS